MHKTISFTVNGVLREIHAHPMARLLDVLREQLELTGTKEGCGEGECGACSVLVDGALVNSCLVPVLQVSGASIETIEGVAASHQQLHKVQQAFLEEGGAQCGICTPGMVMATISLMRNGPCNEQQIRDGLSGNLCRCTGYTRIFQAVRKAMESV